MGANDSPPTTRSIITNYFDWRLNNETITNNRAFTLVRRIASDSEAAYRSRQPIFRFPCSISPIDLHTLNNIRNIHHEIAQEMFADGAVTWTRIITFIAFSAILAEHVIQQQPENSSKSLIISSFIDWTTDFIDTEFQQWLQNQDYWVNRNRLIFNIE